MRKKDLIEFLKRYNRWRRGADIDMPHPADIGISLDAVVSVLETSEADIDKILDRYKFKHYLKKKEHDDY